MAAEPIDDLNIRLFPTTSAWRTVGVGLHLSCWAGSSWMLVLLSIILIRMMLPHREPPEVIRMLLFSLMACLILAFSGRCCCLKVAGDSPAFRPAVFAFVSTTILLVLFATGGLLLTAFGQRWIASLPQPQWVWTACAYLLLALGVVVEHMSFILFVRKIAEQIERPRLVRRLALYCFVLIAGALLMGALQAMLLWSAEPRPFPSSAPRLIIPLIATGLGIGLFAWQTVLVLEVAGLVHSQFTQESAPS